MDRELTERASLLDEKGRLMRTGWAAEDVFDYNVEDIRLRRHRGEWERYRVMNSRYVLDIRYGHTGELGQVGGTLLDLETGEKTVIGGRHPRAGDRFDLDFTGSMPHNLKYEDEKCFLSIGFDGESREIRLRGESFHAELYAHNEGDALVTAVPLGGPRRFALNYKKTFPDLAGHISFRNRDYDMDNDTFLSLWSHRGVWPVRSEWYAGNGAQQRDGHLLALHLLWDCGTEEAPAECAAVVDGRLSKLGRVRCRMNGLEAGKELYLSDDSGRLHLCFRPEYTDASRLLRPGAGQKKRTVYGRVDGSVVTEDNIKRPVQNMCFAMEHSLNRW